MSRTSRLTATAALLLAGLIGCASTKVKKNPGPHDHGFRYYRPKPYLLIQPGGDKADNVNVYKLSLAYMPDFNEEYAVHIRTGIGKNHTKLTLENGWNLTAVDVDIDSKVSEFINSLATLLEKATPLLSPTPAPGPGGAPPAVTEKMVATVQGHNVPLGYYEAVISTDHDGRKRLYGWRYVGFAPFAQCPLEGTGVQCMPCETSDLYGLVVEEDRMVFRKLNDLAGTAAFKTLRDVPKK